VVYRAERVPVGRQVAVKFLHALFADDKDSRARFERETRALSKLAHPHCVSIIDFGYDGAPYLVMDLVAGQTLREILDESPIPIEDALMIARQILAGLAHAHAEGIVHRDIKPANIMVSDQIGTGRHARILDFGLARLVDRGASAHITQSQIAIGTPSYMAPEQTRGEATDARTDIYAVGVLLFEMVTGQRPFIAEDTHALLELHRSMPPPRLADVDGSRTWPPGLDSAIQRALAKDPRDRFQTAVEFADALETRRATSMGDEEETPGVPRRAAPSKHRVSTLLLILLATAGAAFGYTKLTSKKKKASEPAAGAAVVLDAHEPEKIELDPVPAPVPAPLAVPPVDAPVDATIDAPIDAPDAAPDAAIDAPIDAPAAMPDAGEELEVDEPVAPADPEIESVDPAPVPPSPDDVPTEGLAPSVAPAAVAPAAAAVTPAAPAPQVKTVAQALALAKKGRRDEAIAGLRALWRKQPRSANLPYVLGNLYHDKRWWSVAMEHYQAAIKRSPAYKRNATLIRNVINTLASPRTSAKASWFLRKLVGAPAKVHLRAAAKKHKSPTVRKNAAAVLRRF
jgi:eukaryotic-like serine/threonine-protein kinase